MDVVSSTTPDLTRIESSHDEDSDDMPDCPVNDPRYLQWTRRQNSKKTATSSQLARIPQGFKAYQQRKSKPHFDVKSEDQASCGSLVLGFDEIGRPVEIPASINRFLRSYQRDGVKFFWKHYQAREGGLLGDDMGLFISPTQLEIPAEMFTHLGLGKTIQVIAFLAAIMGKSGPCALLGILLSTLRHQDTDARKKKRGKGWST